MASSSASSSSSPSTYSPRNRSRFGDTTFTKVFVGGLAWETPTEELRRYFEQRANCNIASQGKPRPSPRQVSPLDLSSRCCAQGGGKTIARTGAHLVADCHPQSSTLLLSGESHLLRPHSHPPTMKSYMDQPHLHQLLLLLTVTLTWRSPSKLQGQVFLPRHRADVRRTWSILRPTYPSRLQLHHMEFRTPRQAHKLLSNPPQLKQTLMTKKLEGGNLQLPSQLLLINIVDRSISKNHGTWSIKKSHCSVEGNPSLTDAAAPSSLATANHLPAITADSISRSGFAKTLPSTIESLLVDLPIAALVHTGLPLFRWYARWPVLFTVNQIAASFTTVNVVLPELAAFFAAACRFLCLGAPLTILIRSNKGILPIGCRLTVEKDEPRLPSFTLHESFLISSSASKSLSFSCDSAAHLLLLPLCTGSCRPTKRRPILHGHSHSSGHLPPQPREFLLYGDLMYLNLHHIQ
ncbi:hypothetical protein C4D60_Mb03t06430 [Musa balbisiana]|uniref:RRM domain-containing protein n=1 Tax=Musa balbisiana TaxID=52838 RepID=A0A4V4H5X3_MUSBA|nr:hypothetical protein C4D60_Mb03t06430 [Musa balbisiana]